MEDSAWEYVRKGFEAVRSNFSLALAPVFFLFLGYMPMTVKVTGSNENFLSFIVWAGFIGLLIAIPLIYGRLMDVAVGQEHRTWLSILKTDWWNFFVVSVILTIPVILITPIGIAINPGFNLLQGIAEVTIDVISIYVFPLVFITRKRLDSLKLGAKCIIGNFKFSIPLIVLVLLGSFCRIILESPFFYAYFLFEQRFIRFALMLFLSFGGILLDFVVFVSATFILEDKLLKVTRNDSFK